MPDPPRVLMLSWEYPPIVAGGLARAVRKLSEELTAQGTGVQVVTRGRERGRRAEVRGGVRVRRVNEPAQPKDLAAFVQWVEGMNDDLLAAGHELAAGERFDLVHGHDWLVAPAAGMLAADLGVPYVTTIHATEWGRHQGHVQRFPQSHIHGIESWMARRADQVIVCSHYMQEHVRDIYGTRAHQVTVIPNGIDPQDLQPVDDLEALRLRFAAPDERLVLLVGRLVYEKGFQLALEALAPIIVGSDSPAPVRFVVAGSGTHEEALKQQARDLGLMEHGTFLGWIGDDVLHSLYRIADLTVVPSLYEPFGLVALEAMASGCPCIVADTGGLREVVPPGDRVGLRFNGGDAEHLGVMIDRMLTDDDLRERLVAEASEHVLRFDWADVAARTAVLYGDVLEAWPSREGDGAPQEPSPSGAGR
jgi:glycogen(starch) synthase